MDWHDLSANWPLLSERLRERFPHMDAANGDCAPRDRQALTRALASSHDLTVSEAQEQLDDFLSLAQRVPLAAE